MHSPGDPSTAHDPGVAGSIEREHLQRGGSSARAFAFRVLLSVIAIALIAVIELHAAGVWLHAQIPLNTAQRANGQLVVRPPDGLPLPPSLHSGDVLLPADMTRSARAAAYFTLNLPEGTALDIAVIHDGQVVHASIRARAERPSEFERFSRWLAGLFAVPLLSLLVFLTLWRGRGRASAALCAFAMFSLAASGLLALTTTALAGFWLNESVYVAQFAVALPALYVMAEALADTGLSRRARRASRLAVAMLVVAGLGSAGLPPIAFVYRGLTMAHWLNTATTAIAAALIAVAALVLLLGYRHANHESRLRIRWVLWSTAWFLAVVVSLLAVSPDEHPYLAQLVHEALLLTLLGYLYAALRNRLVDVSFVVNRALLYTAITALLFGIFSVLELGLHQLAIGDKLSWALQAIAALLLAIAVSPLHKRLERGLERALFRKQRLAIAALRNFAVECGFIEQEDRLLGIAVEKLIRQCDAVAIYERGRGGYVLRRSRGAWPETVDADDPAFISLRARRQEVDLHDLGSALAPESLALPMTTAEQLTGAVVCKPRDGERFAPDVRSTLVEVAHSLGTALYILRYREQARLVADIAAGRIDEAAARTRAAAMVATTL